MSRYKRISYEQTAMTVEIQGQFIFNDKISTVPVLVSWAYDRLVEVIVLLTVEITVEVSVVYWVEVELKLRSTLP